ncbi:TPA: LysR substrate-binding domain-containing protein [Photobacterium damselae]|uniref:Transcriptional regulator LysR family n=3 Tax=Photobacterium damselae TaxID=38293 RepID=D0YYE2_PHODD|nr:LysR family transcriptional regulator [Photobacterium damselae]EEZ41273.1 transcriptional regulator LysR family [Photobacterium damselae subsp. damselae CIP 102761]EHA1080204.1 LysR family transcriptional regulator [Photobacterium damselae]KAB1178131.1 LysR family transcriptional regulator [Photobacterium damselae subsp. damselae]MBA5683120.1 LysR family transcriptional regulator [Photobacterium damselae subsp. damselae]MCG3811265.1 LysR family transcriptional regulator [Photobacterium dams
MPQIDDLVLFTQVIEHGSFSKVAELNSITKSVVSKRISKLESELGIQLIYRTTRKLTITEAGEVLYHRAKSISQVAQSAFDAVTGYSEALSGTIKMSVPTISGELLLAESVSEFCKKHPGLTVNMSLDNHFVDLVAGNFDLVIRTGYLEDSSLIARHIFNSRWVLCASPEYLAQHGIPNTPKDLLRHNCLGYNHQASGSFDWQFIRNDEVYTLRVAGNFSSDNAAALKKVALAGNGIAYLPTCLVYDELHNEKLVEILSEHAGKVVGIYAVYPYTKKPAKRIQALIEHIRESYMEIKEKF